MLSGSPIRGRLPPRARGALLCFFIVRIRVRSAQQLAFPHQPVGVWVLLHRDVDRVRPHPPLGAKARLGRLALRRDAPRAGGVGVRCRVLEY